MKVAILGIGVEGRSAYKYWKAAGADLTVCDINPEAKIPDGAKAVLGANYLKNLGSYDLIVRSPGVKPWEIQSSARVTSVAGEFMSHCPARIIGVTGTRDRAEVAVLITKILEQAGKRVRSGGGKSSPLDFLKNVRASELVVLELSSFALMDLEISPYIAVCLKISSEHMDWHRSMREYVAAKGNIFWHQRPGDLAVFDARSEFAVDIAELSRGDKLPYMQAPGAYVEDGRLVMGQTDICAASEAGTGDIENVCAAVTATWGLTGGNAPAIVRALKEFTGE